MDETKLRAEFEAWVRRTVTDVTEHDLERDGELYEWDKLNMAFAAWKASRKAILVELPMALTQSASISAGESMGSA